MLPILLSLLATPGCIEFGSPDDRAADDNQAYSGWQDRGRNIGGGAWNDRSSWNSSKDTPWTYTLSYPEVVITPNGDFIMTMLPAPGPDKGWPAPGMHLTLQPLPKGEPIVFKNVGDVERINFSPDGSLAYLLVADGASIRTLNLFSLQWEETHLLTTDHRSLDVTPDGRFLIASNLPVTDLEETQVWGTCAILGKYGSACEMKIVDLEMGTTRTLELQHPLRDLDFYEGKLLVTQRVIDDSTSTQLLFIDPATGETEDAILIPNCADELKLQPNGHLALLSPTTCGVTGSDPLNTRYLESSKSNCPVSPPSPPVNKDPISVINLETRTFERNLPGFGPVIISDDGKRAVGFTRRAEMLSEWNYTQLEHAGIIVVELDTLVWRVIEYGSFEPTYLLAPDGNTLYTTAAGRVCHDPDPCDNFTQWSCENVSPNLTRVDLDTGARSPVAGGTEVTLDQFALSTDKSHLYVLERGGWQNQLKALKFGESTLSSVAEAGASDVLTMHPTGAYLVLGRSVAPTWTLVGTNGTERGTLTPEL